MSAKPVHVAVEGAIATVTLDNPPLNVVTRAMSHALGEALEAIAADDDIRAVVVTGAGERAFCAGSDITEFKDYMKPGQVIPRKLGPQNVVFDRLDAFPKPTVAALRGLVYGGGLEIAVCCDLLVAEADVRIAHPEIKLGVFPSSGGPLTEIETWRTRARRMIDDKFEAHKGEYHNNEILRLQRARGASKLQHPAPMPGMVDAMDGPGIDREAWNNVGGRQEQRRLRIEVQRLDLIEGLMRDVWRERTARAEFKDVAREMSPSREGGGPTLGPGNGGRTRARG